MKNVQLSDFIRGLFHLFRQALEFMHPDVKCVFKRSSPAHTSVVLWIEPGALGLLASPPPLWCNPRPEAAAKPLNTCLYSHSTPRQTEDAVLQRSWLILK